MTILSFLISPDGGVVLLVVTEPDLLDEGVLQLPPDGDPHQLRQVLSTQIISEFYRE